jgi:hydrogenase maturation protease
MRIRVIGCGTRDRRDDAAGMLAVEAAAPALAALDGVEVVLPPSVLDVVGLLEGVDAAVVVDAVCAPGGGRAPGTLVVASADNGRLPAALRSSLSTHGLGVAEAVGIARALGARPRVVFLGVEIGDASDGSRLSPAVAAAIPRLAATVETEVRTLVERSNAPGGTGRPA